MSKNKLIEEIDKQIRNLKNQYIIHIILIILGIILCLSIVGFVIGLILILCGAIGLSKSTKKVSDLNLKKAETL